MNEPIVANRASRCAVPLPPIPTLSPRVDEIIRRHARSAGLTPRGFLGREFLVAAHPHRVACWRELRGLTMRTGRPLSFPQIGRWFHRDHTTIVAGVNGKATGRS